MIILIDVNETSLFIRIKAEQNNYLKRSILGNIFYINQMKHENKVLKHDCFELHISLTKKFDYIPDKITQVIKLHDDCTFEIDHFQSNTLTNFLCR